MLRSAVPPRDARAGAATTAAATCSQEARGDLELRSCADPYCRRGLFCAFRCKHCARDFCEEHRQAEAHSCAAAHTADRRVLTCDDCGQVVQERETLAHAADPAAGRRMRRSPRAPGMHAQTCWRWFAARSARTLSDAPTCTASGLPAVNLTRPKPWSSSRRRCESSGRESSAKSRRACSPCTCTPPAGQGRAPWRHPPLGPD